MKSHPKSRDCLPVRSRLAGVSGPLVRLKAQGATILAAAAIALSLAATPKGGALASDPAASSGLWIGSVTVDAVGSFAGNRLDSPQPAGGDFSFRVILLVSPSAEAHLLDQVFVLTGGGRDPALYSEVDLLESAFDERQRADPEGIIESRRISTPAFAFEPSAQAMSGRLALGETAEVTLALGRDHPANPFAHRAHPQHDGVADGLVPEPGAGEEVYDIVRSIRFELESEPNDKDPALRGTYREVIEGLSAEPLAVAGRFALWRAFPIAALDQ